MKYYFKKALELDIARCNESKLPDRYQALGWAYRKKMQYDSAGIMFQFVRDIGIARKDTQLIRSGLAELSRNWLSAGNMFRLAQSSFELLRLAKIKKDTNDLLVAYWPVSSFYSNVQQYDENLEVVRTCLKLVKGTQRTKLKWWVNYMAIAAYQREGKYDSVIYFARRNIELDDKMKEPRMSYTSLARAYESLNQWDSARYYYQIFYANAFATGQMDAGTYLGLGKCELRFGNFEKALEYYQEAHQNNENGSPFVQANIYRHLSEYYDSIRNYKLAHYYLNKSEAMEDSLDQIANDFEAGIGFMEIEAIKIKSEMAVLAKDNELIAYKSAVELQQKKFVYGGFMLTILLSVIGFYRYKRNRELKSKQSLLNERLRISRELHDEVGATLSGIAMYSHVAKEQMKNSDTIDAEHSLSIMQKSAGDMVGKLSDIVWLINPEQDTIAELFERLEEYARQMAPLRNMQLRTDLDPVLKSMHLPLEARRNIYLFCKEAINNAVKYSNGSLILLAVKETRDNIRFSVGDNGIGFNEMEIKRGNGLNNMQQRAEEIGALFNIHSTSTQGTRIDLHYKLAH